MGSSRAYIRESYLSFSVAKLVGNEARVWREGPYFDIRERKARAAPVGGSDPREPRAGRSPK